MKKLITCATTLFLLMSASAVNAQTQTQGTPQGRSSNKYETSHGLYALGSLAISKTNTGSGRADVGFGMGIGYRYNDWLALDGEFYWGGRNQRNHIKSRIFGITANAKLYPVGYYSPESYDFIQPYLVVGMGGGRHKAKGTGFSESTYIFRLGVGAEWLLAENLGATADVSLHATPGYKRNGEGGATGVFQLGLAYHF